VESNASSIKNGLKSSVSVCPNTRVSFTQAPSIALFPVIIFFILRAVDIVRKRRNKKQYFIVVFIIFIHEKESILELFLKKEKVFYFVVF
jgi:hypothetical protein